MNITEFTAHKGGPIKVHDNGCAGCRIHKADFMLSATDSDGNILDLFLSEAQAIELVKALFSEVMEAKANG